MLRIVKGDLFDSPETSIIVHQCNCVTGTAAHLSKTMFTKFPWSDVYTGRDKSNHDIPGTIKIKSSPFNSRRVINLFGQVFPGFSKYPQIEKFLDSSSCREKYFKQALFSIYKEVEEGTDLAFPWKIGCGAAGGDWSTYLSMLVDFSSYAKSNKDINITVYKNE
jgi:hypothetical protein